MSREVINNEKLHEVSGGIKPRRIYCENGHLLGQENSVIKLNENNEAFCPVCNKYVSVEYV